VNDARVHARGKEALVTRRIAAVAALIVALALPAGTAQAKGTVVHESVTVTVTGPGTSPATLRWSGSCPLGLGFPCPQSLSDYSVVLSNTGVFATTWDSAAPDPSTLGPKYRITYRFLIDGRHTYGTSVVRQDFYPLGPSPTQYVPQQPWLYMAPGQHVADVRLRSGWLIAAPSLVDILRTHGLSVPVPPAPDASASAAPAVVAASRPSRAPNGPSPAPMLAGIAALAALAIAGAVAGRRSSRRRAMRIGGAEAPPAS
jgi:hypothetical protein